MSRSGIQRPVPAPIDLAQLDRATLGDRTLAREVLNLFVDQAASLKAALRAPPVPAALVHKLNGAARGIGAAAVADAAGRLEDALRAGADARPEAEVLAAALDAACAAIAAAPRQP